MLLYELPRSPIVVVIPPETPVSASPGLFLAGACGLVKGCLQLQGRRVVRENRFAIVLPQFLDVTENREDVSPFEIVAQRSVIGILRVAEIIRAVPNSLVVV